MLILDYQKKSSYIKKIAQKTQLYAFKFKNDFVWFQILLKL